MKSAYGEQSSLLDSHIVGNRYFCASGIFLLDLLQLQCFEQTFIFSDVAQ